MEATITVHLKKRFEKERQSEALDYPGYWK
jgi:hypothetical protein